MPTAFDWIRRSENGAELIATIDAMNISPAPFQDETVMGEVACGIRGPCSRCWIYPRLPEAPHCKTCHTIVTESGKLGPASRECLLIWGYVNAVPECLKQGVRPYQTRAIHIRDASHFLAVVPGSGLASWLKEVLIHEGSDTRGALTIFPTTGKKNTFTMGDILCRAIQHDSRHPMDRLRIRFFSKPGQLKAPHLREQQGILTFEATEFMGLLEMATLFKSILRPKEREMVKEVSGLVDQNEKAFHWGRLMGALNIQARDLLADWKVRQWPQSRIKLLYELTEYVNSPG